LREGRRHGDNLGESVNRCASGQVAEVFAEDGDIEQKIHGFLRKKFGEQEQRMTRRATTTTM